MLTTARTVLLLILGCSGELGKTEVKGSTPPPRRVAGPADRAAPKSDEEPKGDGAPKDDGQTAESGFVFKTVRDAVKRKAVCNNGKP